MNTRVLVILSIPLAACSPVPDLLFVTQAADMGTSTMQPRQNSDMSIRVPGDMSIPTGSLCPTAPPGSTSFCYTPGGMGLLNLDSALEISPAAAGCDQTKNVLTASSMGLSCTATLVSAVTTSWGFSNTKPVYMAFSYSTKMTPNSASLSVLQPAGSANEAIKVGAISGSRNVLNFFAPTGTAMNPGFSLTLGGTATKASLTFDWIAVWQ